MLKRSFIATPLTAAWMRVSQTRPFQKKQTISNFKKCVAIWNKYLREALGSWVVVCYDEMRRTSLSLYPASKLTFKPQILGNRSSYMVWLTGSSFRTLQIEISLSEIHLTQPDDSMIKLLWWGLAGLISKDHIPSFAAGLSIGHPDHPWTAEKLNRLWFQQSQSCDSDRLVWRHRAPDL